MKKNILLTGILAGMTAMTAMAGETTLPAAPTADPTLTEYYFLLPTNDESFPYLRKADQKYGTQWNNRLAYNIWNTEGGLPGMTNHHNILMFSTQVQQRIIEDSVGGGTWLRAEFDASWGLDPESADEYGFINNVFRSSHWTHNNAKGPHNGYFAEAMIMHFRNNKRTVFAAGIVDTSNYLDCVSVACSGYYHFNNTAFVGPYSLPVTLFNLGVIAMHEIDKNNYVIGTLTRNCTAAGHNPFSGSFTDNYFLAGEYGHIFNDGKNTVRVQPFISRTANTLRPSTTHHTNAGISGSFEYKPNSTTTLYTRTGFCIRDDINPGANLSVGAQVKPFASRPKDFAGISAGVFKAIQPSVNKREYVVEAMYSFQVNKHVQIMPHVQAIWNPAYSDINHGFVWGMQTVLTF